MQKMYYCLSLFLCLSYCQVHCLAESTAPKTADKASSRNRKRKQRRKKSPPPGEKGKKSKIVLVVSGVVCLLIVEVCMIVFFLRKKTEEGLPELIGVNYNSFLPQKDFLTRMKNEVKLNVDSNFLVDNLEYMPSIQDPFPTIKEITKKLSGIRNQQHQELFKSLKEVLSSNNKNQKDSNEQKKKKARQIMFDIYRIAYAAMIGYIDFLFTECGYEKTDEIAKSVTAAYLKWKYPSFNKAKVRKIILTQLKRINPNYQSIKIKNKTVENYLSYKNLETQYIDALLNTIWQLSIYSFIEGYKLIPTQFEPPANEKYNEEVHTRVMGSKKEGTTVAYYLFPVIAEVGGAILDGQKIDVLVK